jgi:hypothetical protein
MEVLVELVNDLLFRHALIIGGFVILSTPFFEKNQKNSSLVELMLKISLFYEINPNLRVNVSVAE